MTLAQMPLHSHAFSITINASNAQATDSIPTASINTLAAPYDAANFNAIAGYNNQAPNTALNIGASPNGTTTNVGGSQPMPIMQPYLGINYIIALEGIFPSRS